VFATNMISNQTVLQKLTKPNEKQSVTTEQGNDCGAHSFSEVFTTVSYALSLSLKVKHCIRLNTRKIR